MALGANDFAQPQECSRRVATSIQPAPQRPLSPRLGTWQIRPLSGQGDMATLDNDHVKQAYARWAPVYDIAFTAVMRAGRRAAAVAASQASLATLQGAGQQSLVLDVGVGTGLELPMFDPRTRVVGVDLSEPMLHRARMRVATGNLGQVVGLVAMDANRLGFADATFDAAVAPYVMTVVPEPERTLDELTRVVKPGGEIVLVNHIGAESGPIAHIERWLGRRSASLGWRPEFPWEIIGDWIDKRRDITLLERRLLSPMGLFTLVRLRVAAG